MSGNDPTQTYRQEAAELLDQLEQALLDLEHRPGDADLINNAFRALHTIKGSGAMFGFDALPHSRIMWKQRSIACEKGTLPQAKH